VTEEAANERLSPTARIVMAMSQFANEHGIYLGRRSTRLHVALYRLTGGRLGGHHPGLPGARIALLDHVGAKTGRRRTSPMMFHEEGRVVAVAASKAGEPSNPAWFHNLRATPETTIQIGSEVRRVRARVASGRSSWLSIRATSSSSAGPRHDGFRS
jgi:deazaflavin-dependent oxidoreductase (nitroreductase family)